jgi:hypothetical protein
MIKYDTYQDNHLEEMNAHSFIKQVYIETHG